MPIRARIALFGAGIVAITVIVFAVVVYVLVERNLIAQQDDRLRARTVLLIPLGRLQERFPVPVDLRTSDDTFLEVVDRNGTPVFGTAELNSALPTIPTDALKSATSVTPAQRTVEPQPGVRLRVSIRLVGRPDLGLYYVVAGQSTRGVERQLVGLRDFLAIGAGLSLIGALAASWLLAGRALRPLEAMAQTAEEIGRTQDLTRRLPGPQTSDEVQRLRNSFNGMLQRLEEAYQRLEAALMTQRRFVADASHELRTPLTSIRGNIGLILQRPDISPDDRVAALQDVASESERMSRMVQDLLTLARADAGQHLDKTPLDLSPIVQDISRQAQNLHPSRRLELENGIGPAMIAGNADALTQLLWILVDNAVKHTHEGGEIHLRLARVEGLVGLSVSDDGAGFPPGDTERIFERFYRADPARSGDGTGLGLAIAQWIAREHGGVVQARNNPDRGATFLVELPLLKS